MFAQRGTNTRRTEDRLNELIETPISNALSGGNLFSTDVAWKVRRALVLALTVQGARAANALGPSPVDLESFLNSSDEQIDLVVAHELQSEDVAMIELPASERFFYPQVGFFAFPVADLGCITGFGFGFGLPVTPRLALVKFPKATDREFIKAQIETKHVFMGLSLGPEHARLVAIPPDVKEANPEPALIEAITGLRTTAVKFIEDVQCGRENIRAAFRKMGI